MRKQTDQRKPTTKTTTRHGHHCQDLATSTSSRDPFRLVDQSNDLAWSSRLITLLLRNCTSVTTSIDLVDSAEQPDTAAIPAARSHRPASPAQLVSRDLADTAVWLGLTSTLLTELRAHFVASLLRPPTSSRRLARLRQGRSSHTSERRHPC